MSQDEAGCDRDEKRLPPPPLAWIRDNINLNVMSGNKNMEYTATTKSEPFLCDGVWHVTVRFEVSRQVKDVECSKCVEIKLEETGRERLRRRKKEENKEMKVHWIKRKKTLKGRVESVEKLSSMIDLTPIHEDEDKSVASFSLSDDFCAPDDDKGDEVEPLSVARMPSREEGEEEDDNGLFGGLHMVTPSPRKRAKYGSATQVSDDPVIDETSFDEEDSFMDKKRAARDLSRDASLEDSEDDGTDADVSKERIKSEKQFEAAKSALCHLSYSAEEAERALRVIGPPYTRLQAAALEIQRNRQEDACEAELGTFQVKIGMRIRKPFDGTMYEGTVVHKYDEPTQKNDGVSGDAWRIEYTDGDTEDLEFDEILRYRYPPPTISKCRGRAMQCLELFCGRGVVTQEFRQRMWKAISIDIDKNSNATLCADILEMEPTELEFVPDFIWASLPCHTYSRMAGGKHRSSKYGEFEKTEEARLNNFIFLKMVKFMKDAKKKHPHLIVTIENPVGQLSKMPLMAHFEDEFDLKTVAVDYCAFGRGEQKPTMIWTNDDGLRDTLAQFRCAERCCNGGRGKHESVQGNNHRIDYGVIPQPLAEEVASYVDAKFIIDRIRRRKAADPKG